MIKLDDNLLAELGLSSLPKEEKDAFLKHMYETLEMRVGTRLAEKMTEAQMAEFEQFINSNDEQGAFRWLETNFPNYKDVVAEEFENLKAEIKPLAPQIMASSNNAAASQLPADPATQQPMPQTSPMPSQPPQHMQPQQPQSFDQTPAPQPQPAYQPPQPAYGSNPMSAPPAPAPSMPNYGLAPMPQTPPMPQSPPAQPMADPYAVPPMPQAPAAPPPTQPYGPSPVQHDPPASSPAGQLQYPQPVTPPPYNPNQQ